MTKGSPHNPSAKGDAKRGQGQKSQEAMLELERLRKQFGPRYIDPVPFLANLAGQPKSPTEILFLRDDPDCIRLGQQILFLLLQADWPVSAPRPIPASDNFPFSVSPSAHSVGGQVSGVSIVVRFGELDGVALAELPGPGKMANSAYLALGGALMRALGGIGLGTDTEIPSGSVRIVVAPRG
jgi:hypothetical protein